MSDINEVLASLLANPNQEATSQRIPTKPCPYCGAVDTVPMTIAQFVEWFYVPKKERRNIQVIFSDLSADERERLMTGYCDKCWEKLVG